MDYMRKTEVNKNFKTIKNKSRPKGGYFGTVQVEINEKMRGILLDWLIDVHLKFKLQPETLFLTFNILDRYLEKVAV